MTIQIASRFTADGYRVLNFRESQPDAARFAVWPQ